MRLGFRVSDVYLHSDTQGCRGNLGPRPLEFDAIIIDSCAERCPVQRAPPRWDQEVILAVEGLIIFDVLKCEEMPITRSHCALNEVILL